MKFRPLFFLPSSVVHWSYHQAYSEKLMKHWPVRAIFCSIDSLGIWFPYKNDEVIWTWPWQRKLGDFVKPPFISLGFTGDGSFGDARFWSLKDIDEMWQGFYRACEESNKVHNETEKNSF